MSVRIGIMGVLALMTLGPPAGGQRPATLDQLDHKKSEVRRLDQEKTALRQHLSRFQASEAELQEEIEKLSDLVRVSRSRKQDLEIRITRQAAQNQVQRRIIKRLKVKISAGKRRTGLRIRRLYHLTKKGGGASLLQLRDFKSITRDSVYLARLQALDQEEIGRFEEMKRDLQVQQEGMDIALNRLVLLRDELEEESRLFLERESFLQASLYDIKKNRTLYRNYISDLDATVVEMQQTIENLEAVSRRERARPKMQSPAKLVGRLPAPAKGTIIARFGEQDPRYALKKFQRGLVLRVKEKTPVIAVAGGRVVHAGAFRGYQSLVVLDHGSSLFTVYGHLENLTIQQNDWVRRGDQLGEVTYQPVDQSYDIYFEIRHKGKPADPLLWLKPGQLEISRGAVSANGNGN